MYLIQTKADAAGRAGQGLAEWQQKRNKSAIEADHDGGPGELPALENPDRRS
jgi:hypothetical protein